nr:proline dehydrogenase 1, mitochondrial [Quercus suber]
MYDTPCLPRGREPRIQTAIPWAGHDNWDCIGILGRLQRFHPTTASQLSFVLSYASLILTAQQLPAIMPSYAKLVDYSHGFDRKETYSSDPTQRMGRTKIVRDEMKSAFPAHNIIRLWIELFHMRRTQPAVFAPHFAPPLRMLWILKSADDSRPDCPLPRSRPKQSHAQRMRMAMIAACHDKKRDHDLYAKSIVLVTVKSALPKKHIRAGMSSGVLHKLGRRVRIRILQQCQHATGAIARQIHTTRPTEQNLALPVAKPISSLPTTSSSPLIALPLSQILRTYLITSISSSSTLLDASTRLLRIMLESKSILTSIERNPIVRAVLWHTFYMQFCAGESPAQVRKTCRALRDQGYSGVILEYALEVLKDAEGNETLDVETWRHGMLDSIKTAEERDFVGLKWSGMGVAAMKLMKENAEPTKHMNEAMNVVCMAAARKNVSLLPAAEETWSLDGFFSWCLRQQRIYNKRGTSVVYSTYQAYLKQMPEALARHLEDARQNNFALGVKLVRGAYLGSDIRGLIHPSIEATHSAYDELASALIHRSYNDFLQPSTGSSGVWPQTNVVLATHNAISVRKAQALRRDQYSRGDKLTNLVFAQLQGMADEVSCNLLTAATNDGVCAGQTPEKVFKCTTWGSMYQCLNYLLRRASENKDAAGRTSDSRKAAQAELGRRLKVSFGIV